jgi:hypothetical protein
MSGTRRALLGFVLLGGFAATARAEEMVPGGWSSQIGFQTFGGSGFGGFYGTPGLIPYPSVMSFGGVPMSRNVNGPTPLWFQGQPQTTNALVPLADTIRRSSRRRPSR